MKCNIVDAQYLMLWKAKYVLFEFDFPITYVDTSWLLLFSTFEKTPISNI